ncbi:MAG: hypothetical protein MI924_27640, partial [Chloroflexales bacterium]|nr:hypothetical protein [Chloroflexales bacterium]
AARCHGVRAEEAAKVGGMTQRWMPGTRAPRPVPRRVDPAAVDPAWYASCIPTPKQRYASRGVEPNVLE